MRAIPATMSSTCSIRRLFTSSSTRRTIAASTSSTLGALGSRRSSASGSSAPESAAPAARGGTDRSSDWPGSATRAGGGGGSCVTGGTFLSGTDAMPPSGSPRRMPCVPGWDGGAAAASGDGSTGSGAAKPCRAETVGPAGAVASGAASVTRIGSVPNSRNRPAVSPPRGWSASASISSSNRSGGGRRLSAIALTRCTWNCRTRPIISPASHGTPFTSMRPARPVSVTGTSSSSSTSARNSASWASVATGSRNTSTQRANRAAIVSGFAIETNLGAAQTRGNAGANVSRVT